MNERKSRHPYVSSSSLFYLFCNAQRVKHNLVWASCLLISIRFVNPLTHKNSSPCPKDTYKKKSLYVPIFFRPRKSHRTDIPGFDIARRPGLRMGCYLVLHRFFVNILAGRYLLSLLHQHFMKLCLRLPCWFIQPNVFCILYDQSTISSLCSAAIMSVI